MTKLMKIQDFIDWVVKDTEEKKEKRRLEFIKRYREWEEQHTKRQQEYLKR